jgi:hypothetical protein
VRVYAYRRISQHWGLAFGIPIPHASLPFWAGFCAFFLGLVLWASVSNYRAAT